MCNESVYSRSHRNQNDAMTKDGWVGRETTATTISDITWLRACEGVTREERSIVRVLKCGWSHLAATDALEMVCLIIRYYSCKNSVCSRNNPQLCLDPPKSKLHDGQKRINEVGKWTRENTAFWTILRGGVRVQARRVAVWIVLIFGRLAVMTTQAS